jgi:hypothetical protein
MLIAVQSPQDPGVIRLHDGLLDARAPFLAGFERLPGDSMGAMQNG